jgi:hypothetical protein
MSASPPAAPPPSIAAAPAAPSQVATSVASPPPVRFVRYGFDHAELSMSLSDWKALSPDRAEAACTPTAKDPHVIVCEAAPAPIGGAYSARDRRGTFVDGVLARLTFTTSIDGFDWVMARLDGDYGKPAEVVRDTVRLSDGLVLPHILMTWTNGLATIQLADPERTGGLLRVQASLNADTYRLAADRG